MEPPSLRVFSTCPATYSAEKQSYLHQVENVARWSESARLEGILVYTDNGTVDPWLVSQVIIENTQRLCPLVAVQPVYMHPYSVAKMVATLGFLRGRRVYLNMVAGGFKNDLTALGDGTPHDERYGRLVEYTSIIMGLLRAPDPFTFEGAHYRVTNLRMSPPLPAELLPGVFMSGSSDAGMSAARQLGATAVQYPKPVSEYERQPPENAAGLGMRIGIVARERSDEAWEVARARFPSDRRGEIARQLANKVSDSEWHKQLSRLGSIPEGAENPYWLVPFEHYKTNCPYLVGDYGAVSEEIARYVRVGYRSFILDIPPSEDELAHIGLVFERAQKRVGA